MGIVEGLTEFLPVSSTGHLILAGSLLGFTGDKIKVFEIAIQSGAILAVMIVYRERLASTLAGLGSDARARRFALNVAVAFVPAVVLGLLFSFLAAWLCVRWLLRYVSTHTFVPFAWYRIAFGLVVLATAWSGVVVWQD